MWKSSKSIDWSLCAGVGVGDPDHGHFSRWRTAVFDRVFVDCVRRRLYAAVRERRKGGVCVKIVVVKSPKFLCGVLKRIFHMA